METQRPLTTVEEKQRWFEQYNNGIHRLGRSWTLVCLIALVGMPFLMGWALDTAPDMHVFWRWLSQCSHYLLSHQCGGVLDLRAHAGKRLPAYLSFITGNLSNLKIPCAINARDLANAKVGTPENEVISTLSVATSSLVTVVVLALGVALLVPLAAHPGKPCLNPRL